MMVTYFFFQAEDGIRDVAVTGVQTCALPIYRDRGETHRDVVLIPASAHGTNPASAAMAGMRVVVVATAPTGDVDIDDLQHKAVEHRARLACLMIKIGRASCRERVESEVAGGE